MPIAVEKKNSPTIHKKWYITTTPYAGEPEGRLFILMETHEGIQYLESFPFRDKDKAWIRVRPDFVKNHPELFREITEAEYNKTASEYL